MDAELRDERREKFAAMAEAVRGIAVVRSPADELVERLAETYTYAPVTWGEEVCFFCGLVKDPRGIQLSHEPDCLWANAGRLTR